MRAVLRPCLYAACDSRIPDMHRHLVCLDMCI